jgi:tRNA 2-thiocytidine biosynthesis protein TtcA
MLIKAKNQKVKLEGIIKQVYKKTGKAVSDYNMLEDKDRILVAVSGGKDSLSLLEVLLMRKVRIPIEFSLVVCCIDMGLEKEQRQWLSEYFQSKKIEYVIKKLFIDKKGLDCFWCSHNRRKLLFNTAKEFNCNKLALAHHQDDIIETILLNLFAKGEVSAMKPSLQFFKGEITMIRPFAYLEEKQIKDLAQRFNFYRADWKCPRDKITKRAGVKKAVKSLEKDFPYIKTNIFRALKKERIKQDYLV